MPELPEVETIKLELEEKIKGKKIKDVEIGLPKIINISAKKFKEIIKGLEIKNVLRRAKLLIIKFSSNWNLVIHLKMTGQLVYNGQKEKYTHLIFYFADGDRLLFNDLRQFGYLKLLQDEELKDLLSDDKIGPEPLEKYFTLEVFKNLLPKKQRQKIKPLLMDQGFIAGIGNIYAQEICFYAQVAPKRLVSSLKEKEIRDIYKGIKKILLSAIKYKGSSVDNYRDIYGKKGEYVPLLKVYQRKGEKCFRCGGKIEEIRLGSRGTSYCLKCQI